MPDGNSKAIRRFPSDSLLNRSVWKLIEVDPEVFDNGNFGNGLKMSLNQCRELIKIACGRRPNRLVPLFHFVSDFMSGCQMGAGFGGARHGFVPEREKQHGEDRNQQKRGDQLDQSEAANGWAIDV